MGGFSIASEIINSEMGRNEPRVLNKNETFGVQNQKQQIPIQEAEDKPKKKKKKKNKDK
jgi:hypothetical protein